MNVSLIVCMYVWNLYKFTFLNRSEPNFAHVSPLVWKRRRVCMDPKFLTFSTFWALHLWRLLQNYGHKMAVGATVICDAILSVISAGVCVTSRHYVVADGGVTGGSLISAILAGVPLTLQKWRRSRRQPQRRIPYSGGCSPHVMDITFNRATGPSTTALYTSFQLLFLWPTGNHVLSDDSCAFLLQVCSTVGNASGTLWRERDPYVYNLEPHQTGSD
jgi:hypothetical protein